MFAGVGKNRKRRSAAAFLLVLLLLASLTACGASPKEEASASGAGTQSQALSIDESVESLILSPEESLPADTESTAAAETEQTPESISPEVSAEESETEEEEAAGTATAEESTEAVPEETAAPAPTDTPTPEPTKTPTPEPTNTPTPEPEIEEWIPEEDGSYTSKEEVAAYIHYYGKLPGNYITKNEAESLGWVASKGNLWKVAPGMSIGGSRFGNYEGLLPKKNGRQYYECDIDYDGGRRNAKRIVYSDDGLIFYTEDHYETFEQLY